MSTRRLLEAFEAWREQGQSLALATVIDTEGSTYSKPGACMIVTAEGQYQGLLSGGCLEGDLVEHARDVIGSGAPRAVRYDMRDHEEDQLWGLGLGCDGALTVFVQPLTPANDYAPFAALAARAAAGTPAAWAIVVEVHGGPVPPGAALVADAEGSASLHLPMDAMSAIEELCRAHIGAARAELRSLEVAGATLTLLLIPLATPPRVLILGAGPDVLPVVALADELGWRVTVADHRPGYLEKIAAAPAEQALEVSAANLGDSLDPNAFQAAVVMSHHLQTDLAYLRCLAASHVPYIGLLGPQARRARLMQDLEQPFPRLGERVYGPVGLDIGADSPEAIALAIVAEMHAVMKSCSGGHLSGTRI